MSATPRIVALVATTVLGCTDAHLYGLNSQPNFADRISLQGDLCTDDPSAVAFPVKVLVVIDGTAAMVTGDPTGRRAAMLQTFVDRWSGPNHSFGFLQFGAQSRNLTSGYASDAQDIQPAIDAIGIGTADVPRNYFDALRATATTVQDDLLASTPGTRSRTRYVVLFIAAGPPGPDLKSAWCRAHGFNPAPNDPVCLANFTAEFCGDIQPTPADCELALYRRSAADLRRYALDHGAADLVFNTFALADDARTNDLLTQMSFASQGAFTHQTPATLNLLQTDIAASSSVLLQRGFVVYNPNMMLRSGHPVPDTDGDGLPDEQERMLGTRPDVGDSDGDQVGDAIELRLAAPGLDFDPLVAHLPETCLAIDPPDRDSDGDGLLDCEEAVLRTDASLVDTDRDALPDLVEVRRGSNPLADDLLTDSDADGIPNGIQVREGMGALDGAASLALEYGYRYRVVDMGTQTRLEALPHDPLPGVLVETIDGSTPTVGGLRYQPGPPATLAWAEDVRKGDYGTPVDVSRGGPFQLKSAGGRTLGLKVTAAALPPVDAGPSEQQLLVRPTVRSCFHYDVRNIPLAATGVMPGGRPGAGWNNIQVYLAELPEKAPNGCLVFNLATVPVRFVPPDKKTPDRPFITLEQFSFVLLEGTP